MNKHPKISVLIPIYNVEKYLRQCLDSVINQTLQDIEIICLDDGSTDSSAVICDEYAAKDPRIKVIHKQNSGYGHSMNLGLKNATGEYIGIIESDDFAELNMFEELYTLAKKTDADIVKSDFILYWSDPIKKNKKNDSLKYYPTEKIITMKSYPRIIHITPSIWSAIYKKTFLDKNDINFLESPGASYQDTSFFFLTSACAEKIVLTDKAYLNYRQDNESSSVKSKNKVFCVCDEIQHIERYLDNHLDIKANIEQYKWLFQYIVYYWNYKRVSPDFTDEFIDRFSSEFAEAYKNNILSDTFYKYINKKSLMTLINNKKIHMNYTFPEKLFSIKNSPCRRHKIISILGIQIRIRRK